MKCPYTPNQLEKMLEAIRHLRSTYRLAKDIEDMHPSYPLSMSIARAESRRAKKNSDYVYSCPLCVEASKIRKFDGCNACMWKHDTGKTCSDNGYDLHLLDDRIRRLTRWEKMLVKWRNR